MKNHLCITLYFALISYVCITFILLPVVRAARVQDFIEAKGFSLSLPSLRVPAVHVMYDAKKNTIMKRSMDCVRLLLFHVSWRIFYPWTVARGHHSLFFFFFLLALSPLNCTCFLYFPSRCCSLALCATPAPMWVLGSLMNLQEARNPYVSEHTG